MNRNDQFILSHWRSNLWTIDYNPLVFLGSCHPDEFSKKEAGGTIESSGQPICLITNYPLFCPSFSRLASEGPDMDADWNHFSPTLPHMNRVGVCSSVSWTIFILSVGKWFWVMLSDFHSPNLSMLKIVPKTTLQVCFCTYETFIYYRQPNQDSLFMFLSYYIQNLFCQN